MRQEILLPTPNCAQAAAAADLECARSCGAFDAFISNDDFEDGYSSLAAVISRFRPDIIPPKPPAPADGAATADAAAAASALGRSGGRGQEAGGKRPAAPPLLLCGPAGGGREALSAQLLARLPDVFALPPRITDRKPVLQGEQPAGAAGAAGAGQKGGAAGASAPGGGGAASAGVASDSASVPVEVVKPEALAKLAAAGQLALQWQEAGGAQVAVTVDAVRKLSEAGGCCLLVITNRTLTSSTSYPCNLRTHNAL